MTHAYPLSKSIGLCFWQFSHSIAAMLRVPWSVLVSWQNFVPNANPHHMIVVMLCCWFHISPRACLTSFANMSSLNPLHSYCIVTVSSEDSPAKGPNSFWTCTHFLPAAMAVAPKLTVFPCNFIILGGLEMTVMHDNPLCSFGLLPLSPASALEPRHFAATALALGSCSWCMWKASIPGHVKKETAWKYRHCTSSGKPLPNM